MFQARFRAFKPRHPLARLLAAIVGVLAVAALITLGLFALVALAIGGALFMLVNALRAPARPHAAASAAGRTAAPGVIEGEFSVVQDSAARPQQSGSH
jgi:hypothetical protein